MSMLVPDVWLLFGSFLLVVLLAQYFTIRGTEVVLILRNGELVWITAGAEHLIPPRRRCLLAAIAPLCPDIGRAVARSG